MWEKEKKRGGGGSVKEELFENWKIFFGESKQRKFRLMALKLQGC